MLSIAENGQGKLRFSSIFKFEIWKKIFQAATYADASGDFDRFKS